MNSSSTHTQRYTRNVKKTHEKNFTPVKPLKFVRCRGGVNHPCEVYLYVVYHAGKADFPGKFANNGKLNSKFCSRKVELNVLKTTQLRYFKL